VCWGVCLVLLITIRQINVHRNKVKERICTAPDYVHTADIEFMDMTDLKNPGRFEPIGIANDRIPLRFIMYMKPCIVEAMYRG
jgi:hypothetical protein